MRMICASIVSAPTLAARTRSDPVVLMVAPMTASSSRLVTGIGSPVIIDSFTGELPDRTVASTGTFSPGRMMISSPTATSSMGISDSAPSRTTRAVRACRPRRARIASPVPAFALASSSRPNKIKVMMTPTASKYTSRTSAGNRPGAIVASRL
jgi:hypothetical protein